MQKLKEDEGKFINVKDKIETKRRKYYEEKNKRM